MSIYEELSKRGLIAQITNEEKVKEILEKEKVYFYIGFDPTADSLHVGHLTQLMIISRMQKAGHIPIILFGGATALVGDPSGKTDMRKMLSPEQINHNIDRFKQQAKRFVVFSDNKAIIVNNSDWLSDLNYIDFLREIGINFSVNKMLAAECYKQRLEKGLTFFELNYMIMQSYDFFTLNKKFGCKLELGGDDQWSNIIGGVELIRKLSKKEAFGLTFKLLTTSEGKKMGKTEKGAIWIDPEKTSPYEFYQYWRNINDNDVINCMNMLTFIPTDKIQGYSKVQGQELNKIKEILAFEITKIVHGESEAQKALKTSRSLFEENTSEKNMPQVTLPKELLENNTIGIIEILIKSNLAPSKSEARRLISQGGISVDNKKINDVNYLISEEQLNKSVIIKKGKKTFKRVSL